MQYLNTKKIIASILMLTLFLNFMVFPAAAVKTYAAKPVQLNRITLESTAYSIINTDKDYICIGENLPSKKKVKMTVLNKSNYKAVRIYSFDYDMYWNIRRDDSSLLQDTRYTVLSYPSGKNAYKNYILDMITGKKVQLALTTTSAIRINPSPACDTVFYGYEDGKYNTYCSYIKLSTGETVSGIKYEAGKDRNMASLWSENGRFSVFYKDGRLILLDAVSMKQTVVSEFDNEKDMIIGWLPSDKGILFIDNNELKLYLAADKKIIDTGIPTQQAVKVICNGWNTVCWNRAKTKFAVYTADGKIHYYDLRSYKKEEQDISKNISEISKKSPYTDTSCRELVWRPDDGKIGVIGAGVESTDVLEVLLVWNGKNFIDINTGTAMRPVYYRNYVLFYSDCFRYEEMEPNSLKMYDPETNKLYTFGNVKNAEIKPDGKGIIVYKVKNKTDHEFSAAYLVDMTKYTMGQKVPGFETMPYDCGYIRIKKDDPFYSNGKLLGYNYDNQYYSIYNYNTLKKEELLKFSKAQCSNLDRTDWITNDNGKTLFVWKDKLKTMYIYNYFDSLMKIQLNKKFATDKSNYIVSTDIRNVLLFNEKGTKNLYIYRLTGK
ncbi:MAG TPA: hypothetical protein VHP38_06870 [Ruminiclostridium sp.]|nr:hypothetical protein [Ruminiclostridium sp.]